MSDTATRVKIGFATKEFTVMLDGGRITVTSRGSDVLGSNTLPQAGKAIISAVCELEELQQSLLEATMKLSVGEAQRLFGADELPLKVDIDGGKYAFGCAQAGAFNVVNEHIDRYGEHWIDSDELQHKEFWFALAGTLHNTRRRLALLTPTGNEDINA